MMIRSSCELYSAATGRKDKAVACAFAEAERSRTAPIATRKRWDDMLGRTRVSPLIEPHHRAKAGGCKSGEAKYEKLNLAAGTPVPLLSKLFWRVAIELGRASGLSSQAPTGRSSR